ncbi:acetate and sugar kinases/Hsc70/actin family protein [Saccharibacillus alkalitolerans]|uniref:Type II pantothenate kinase n=1 Tax=Saccharibacillus alkalitolerans TaxID=2705290 RepID=A0ABX0FC83_9BACL|nr:type II pantothenate kinase [Saccharibacillus alkalitolerans]NGZ77163.1 type II pantothenate kinase [Saccharibacillus alkalitolerans]
MARYAGIDAGGTLIKIAYLDDAETEGAAPGRREAKRASRVPRLFKFPTSDIGGAAAWIENHLPPGTAIGLAGGQAAKLRSLLPDALNAVDVPEFEATTEGAVRILAYESGEENPAERPFLLVNVGTGTSLHLIDGAERPRLGGIGLGGGTIVGLTGMLCGVRDYAEIARMAPLGDREAVDLTVGQIYAPAPPPIAGDLTAANFARPDPPAAGVRPQDYAAAVIGMVAEIVVTVGVQAARLHGTNRVVYVGSSYEDNELLRGLTARFTEMLGCEAEIPKYGAYSGAVGALHQALSAGR